MKNGVLGVCKNGYYICLIMYCVFSLIKLYLEIMFVVLSMVIPLLEICFIKAFTDAEFEITCFLLLVIAEQYFFLKIKPFFAIHLL
ncbi:hypothetical protein EK743_07305 [Campylobacter lari]|nr:hypothetical protein [Campylobacter lari]